MPALPWPRQAPMDILHERGGTAHRKLRNTRLRKGLVCTAAGRLVIKDTVVKDSNSGIRFAPFLPGSTTSCSMDHETAANDEFGISVASSEAGTVAEAAIRDRTISGNGSGVAATGQALGFVQIEVKNGLITIGVTGVAAEGFHGAAVISISNCVISDNQVGFDARVVTMLPGQEHRSLGH